MDKLLKLYHHLPYPARVIAATVKGYQLNHWRYGPETEDLVHQVLDCDNWSREEWNNWSQERIAFILNQAATKVPYYKEKWSYRRRHGDYASWEELKNWPVLKKEEVRKYSKKFLLESCKPNQMFEEHTSGSSGFPLKLWFTKNSLRYFYAIYEARVRRWHGLSRFDKWAIFGGQLVCSVRQQNPPFWVWNQASHQLYLSSYHINIENVQAYLDAIASHDVKYILTYPSAIASLAEMAVNQKLTGPKLGVVISNAEPLFSYQRDLIKRIFDCETVNTYGMSELTAAASECFCGSMHLWPEAGFVEIFSDDEDNTLSPGQIGRVVCTGLVNEKMPLIHYEVGDRGSLSDAMCDCGRGLPILEKIEGRIDDVLITEDGKRIGRLDPVFKADIPIKEAQIIQEEIDSFRIKYVPYPEFNHQKLLIDRLKERLGDVSVQLEEVENIPKGPNGKFKSVINLLKNQF